MTHRHELYFWRLGTGIALALAGVLALRGTVAHTKPQPVVEAHRQSSPDRRNPMAVELPPIDLLDKPLSLRAFAPSQKD